MRTVSGPRKLGVRGKGQGAASDNGALRQVARVVLPTVFSGFAGLDEPLTSDGLRPNLVPLFGVSAAF